MELESKKPSQVPPHLKWKKGNWCQLPTLSFTWIESYFIYLFSAMGPQNSSWWSNQEQYTGGRIKESLRKKHEKKDQMHWIEPQPAFDVLATGGRITESRFPG